MTHPSDGQPRDAQKRFSRRTNSAPESRLQSVPSDAELFEVELMRIEQRIAKVVAAGRDAVADGTDSYDNATVAVIRLAALFENDKRFEPFLEDVTDLERRGVAGTRNMAAHRGYASMDDEVFWDTITVQVPALIAKLRG